MDRQFTDNEWQQIQTPPTDKGKLAVFYRHWVTIFNPLITDYLCLNLFQCTLFIIYFNPLYILTPQCLKESYIKAVGAGLSHGLQRIDFKLGTSVWALDKVSPSLSLLLPFSLSLSSLSLSLSLLLSPSPLFIPFLYYRV